ncbi:hypothetical protein SCUCBS95973_009242 [Sporothrix curviconia]|uniref:Serine aminopeptidase S33 domain-containing protein n=1 Tax=Sporothrix curviconia TaxID=1260050 RepID=A0ABP0CWM1_9PEZI
MADSKTTTDAAAAARDQDYSTQRLAQRYRFNDVNMDLFFLAALGWTAAGGLSVGEAFYIAGQIQDGSSASWTAAFERQGGILQKQADAWLAQDGGRKNKALLRAAGETRLRAFCCFRSAWQFVVPGEQFVRIFRTSQALFSQAIAELGLPATAFSVAYGGGQLPGHYFAAQPGKDNNSSSSSSNRAAPTILILGGADTCHEDRFVSQGRLYWDRGYAVALADLPGQGLVQAQNLFWEPEADKPIAAVLDALEAQFGVDRHRTALLGMSLGGYFVSKAAAAPDSLGLGAIIATPVLTRPEALFSLATAGEEKKEQGKEEGDDKKKDDGEPSPAAANMAVLAWKAGIQSIEELKDKWAGVVVDPANVQVPFLSVLGMQEGGMWKEQTQAWHDAIPSPKKKLLTLDAETGADVHCQANNLLRLVQEVDTFLQDLIW